MVRVVTQETYDEIVKENMEEFDMSPEDAVKEAVAQFEAQGVDLTNIIKDLTLGGGDGHLVSRAVDKLKKLGASGHDDEVSKELEVLKAECDKDIAHRIRAGKDGAYNVLLDLLDARQKIYMQDKKERDRDFLLNVLNCIVALMDTQPDLLDDRGANLIKSLLDTSQDDDEILIATLRWTTHCCFKHEMNKQTIFTTNIGDDFKSILLNNKNNKVLSECFLAIRKFTLDDDVRVEFGKAHEHSRDFGILLLEPMTKLLKENTKPPLVSELMLTQATLLVRHELCKMVADCGVDVLFTVLADNYDNVATVTQAYKLITALAGHDEVKRDLVKSGIVPIIISLLTRHSNNAAAAKYGLKCIAALTLREPAHSQLFLDGGVAEGIVQCLKVHADNDSVQKNACWAIRNMVARCRTHNQQFKELGIEPLLNAAYDKYSKDFGFDIKSALRDLECDVKLDEQWTGKGVQLQKCQTHNHQFKGLAIEPLLNAAYDKYSKDFGFDIKSALRYLECDVVMSLVDEQ